MAALKLIETHTKDAQIYHGAAACKENITKIAHEFSFPPGIMLPGEIEEFGFNRSTGFIWVKRKKKVEHKFTSIGKVVVYDALVTSFIEKKHMTKLMGLKAKEMFIAVGICTVTVGEPSDDMIKCVTPSGISRAYPISAFVIEDEKKDGK